MELKGLKDRSDDYEDSEDDGSGSSREKQSPAASARPPERAALLNGVIFNRQERDRSTAEVAQTIVPGAFAPEQVLPPVRLPGELPHVQPPLTPELAQDDEDDEEPEQSSHTHKRPSQTPPVRVPLPVSGLSGSEYAAVDSLPDAQPGIEPAAMPQNGVNPSAEQTQAAAYPSFDQLAEQKFASTNPAEEHSPQPEQFGQVPPEASYIQPTGPAEYAQPAPPRAAGGEGTLPPPPPERPVPGASGPEEPGSEAHYAYVQRQAPNTYHPQPVEYATRRSLENAQEDMRRRMAARTLMLVALAWYLGRRPARQLREQVGHLQETTQQQQAELANLAYQQQAAQARVAEQNRQIEQFTRPQAAVPGQEQTTGRYHLPGELPPVAEQAKIVGEPGQEIVLHEGERLERAAAGYSEVINRQGHVVEGALQHGEAYWQDRAPERQPSPFGARDARFTQGGGTGGFAPPVSSPGVLPGSQNAMQYGLPMNDAGQTPAQEAQHLLPPPKRHPVLVAVTSPWLWLGVGILLVAFFAAATI